jgi:hypothetical protein
LADTLCPHLRRAGEFQVNSGREWNPIIDTEKIDEAVLALLYLTLPDGSRAWKGFDGTL